LFSKEVEFGENNDGINTPTENQKDINKWGLTEAINKVEYIHWLLKLLIPVNFLGGYLIDIQSLFIPQVLQSICKLLIYLDANFNREIIVKTKEGNIKGVMRQAKPAFPLLYSPQTENKEGKRLATLPLRAFFSMNTDILRLTSTLVHVNKIA